MKEVMEKLRKFNEERDWDQFHSEVNLSKSISIEASELLECFQWSDVEFDKAAVCEELADVMLYCLQLADKLGIDPKGIMINKMQKNAEKYPVCKAKGNSKKYNQI